MRRRRLWWRGIRFTLGVVNAMGVSTGSAHSARIVRLGVELADVPALSEASKVQVARAIDQRRYQSIQLGGLGFPESGVALVVDRSRARLDQPRLIVGSKETSEGGGIRMRPILTARLTVLGDDGAWHRVGRIAATHAPPDRAPRARAAYMARLALVPARYKLGDLNLPRSAVARLLPRKRMRTVGVLTAAVSKRDAASSPISYDVTSDHPALTTQVTVDAWVDAL